MSALDNPRRIRGTAIVCPQGCTAHGEDWHDPLAGYDRGPCPDYAPDTLAPDPADRDVCTTCYYRAADHTTEVPA